MLRCHSAPGSGSCDPDSDVTAAAGIRLIGVDRPGYGGSDPVKEGFATIGLAADDAATVLANPLPLGSRAGVAGWSPGRRVALALAARHPELVGRVGVIAAPGPDEQVPRYGCRTGRWSTRCAACPRGGHRTARRGVRRVARRSG